jgi:hypothetical protein
VKTLCGFLNGKNERQMPYGTWLCACHPGLQAALSIFLIF